MSVIFTDTDCELWYTMTPELGCEIIKMPYTIDDTEYFYDNGETTDFKDFYKRVRAGSMPVTSALNPEQYTEIFEPFFKAGEDILYISFSTELSGTFEHLETAINALSAKYPAAKFRRFDTKNISWGAGLQAYYALKEFKKGKTLDEVIAFLEKFTNEIGVYFMVDSLQHLKKGGRLTGLQAALGTLLAVKPILTVTDGKLAVTTKVNGVAKAFSYIAERVKEKATELDKYPIVVVDADNCEGAERLIAKINDAVGETEIWRYPVGPVIGTHCGPGTLGVIFHIE